MAAYGLRERFEAPPKYPIPDAGMFQYGEPSGKPNKIAFLSKTPRKTQNIKPIYTHSIYDAKTSYRIPNITSLQSKMLRFPYEAFSEEDLKEIVCKCGIAGPCECSTSENELEEKVVCQGKIKRRIFKGVVSLNDLGDEGISVPGRKDLGFCVPDNGRQSRMMKSMDGSPPFYNINVYEATKFYQGCKWSRWTSKRRGKAVESGPGPTDYFVEKRELSEDEICAERIRAHKRKTSKQLRFIEMVQRQNIREGRPGPPHYYPTVPKGTNLQFIGSKCERFPISKFIVHPGPADYWVRRHFDPFPDPETFSRARRPEPACFGMKSRRFASQKEEGPSAASYDTNYKSCQFVHCPTAPFSSSAVRFKPISVSDSDDEDEITKLIHPEPKSCPKLMWQFKSKTIRLKPLVKKYNEASPADLPQPRHKVTRSLKAQYFAPFFSSEGRLQPWHNWMPVHGKLSKSNQEFLNLEKPKCMAAFKHGPLFRAPRFCEPTFITPAPNEYNVDRGVETVLKTYNKRLLDNVDKHQRFKWQPPTKPPILNPEQKYKLLLQKSIDILEIEDSVCETCDDKIVPRTTSEKAKEIVKDKKVDDSIKTEPKQKLMKFFLYSHQMPRPF